MLLITDPARGGALRPAPVHTWDRIGARVGAVALDSALASGTAPEHSVRLALRAERLVSARYRSHLAASLDRLVAAAEHPPCTRDMRIPPARRSVRTAARGLAEIAMHLRRPQPVAAAGVAQVSTLLGDGLGPLYNPSCSHELPARVSAAIAALDPSRWD